MPGKKTGRKRSAKKKTSHRNTSKSDGVMHPRTGEERLGKKRLANGHLSGLTDVKRERIVEAVRSGCYVSHIAAACGFRRRTYYNWLKQGRLDIAEGKTDTPHAKFTAEIEVARSQAVVDLQRVIFDAATVKGDWKAAALYLSRTQQHLWGPQNDDVEIGRAHGLDGSQREEIEVSDDGLSEYSTEDLEALAECMDREDRIHARAQAKRTKPGSNGGA